MMKVLKPLLIATGLFAAAAGPVSAHHTLKQREEALRYRENYLELTERPAPAFTLKDADDRTVGLDDFRGKVVILNFVFATCTDVCPLHSDLIADIQKRMKSLRDKVQFISVTTHPEFDTPEILKPYGEVHGLDTANWTFLTSGPERPTETRELAERYGLKFTPVGNGQFVHGVVTNVIDQEGQLRARYHGLKFNVMNLIVHVTALINEYHE
ncbi:MAG: SCO family protein [Hyphomicrobiaceae bacterium]|nr:MAG: SCO family protein [Hyphomicrobiaceae bacterium]